ncbi:MAG: magnesium transporter, partial [Rhodospirillales bacterium]|nr:magnesium transporter [Acetobacter sp.]
ESWLGLLNGFFTGLTAGVGMYLSARWSGHTHPVMLAVVVVGALTVSCVVAGLVGALTPIGLKRCGFDPATASSIVLTTITDLVSVAALLALAAWLVVGRH